MAEKIEYAIIPRTNAEKHFLEDIYHQYHLLKYLTGKNPLIPPFSFIKTTLPDLLSGSISIVPEEEKIKDSIDREIYFPVPVFTNNKLYTYQEVKDLLLKSKTWLEQILDFYIFLSNESLFIDHKIQPDDFLYDREGNIRFFLGYNFLSMKIENKGIENYNLHALAFLLDRYLLKDFRLYNLEYFDRLYGRLMKPLLYGDGFNTHYQDFKEIKKDIRGEIHHLTRHKNIGLFLDVANILIGLKTELFSLKINFFELLEKIYGKRNIRKVKKCAVLFWPIYNNDEKTERVWKRIQKVKDYLIEYGFEIGEVDNDQTSPKEIDEKGEEYDLDDQLLIQMMEEAIAELDSILLLSGDKHFIPILKEYQKQGKEIKVISLSPDSTSKEIVEEFDHSYLDEYYDCLKLS